MPITLYSMPIYQLDNQVQHYPWGTWDTIPQLLGIPNPAHKPFAELWMGAHPLAPSKVLTPEAEVSLLDMIGRNPKGILGGPVYERFGAALPFLFKVLSAAQPLSIQAHPSKQKAASGFERENTMGVPLDAPERNYRDANHKPELIVALESFEGLCGFRPIDEIIRLVRLIVPRKYRQYVGRLMDNPGKIELAVFFYRFITLSASQKREVLYFTSQRIPRVLGESLESEPRRTLEWTLNLMAIYPGDIGALAPLILNLFRLEAGQAVFIAPGQIHAYLKGTGLEIMANSDNVLRGALTSKHIDVPELLSCLSFTTERSTPFEPIPMDDSVEEYRTEASEFRLDRIRLADGRTADRRRSGPEILLCLEGEIVAYDLTGGGRGASLTLTKGKSAFIPAETERYRLQGEGLLFRAGVSA